MAKKKRYDTKNKGKKRNTREDDAAARLTYLHAAAHVVAPAAPAASRLYTRVLRQAGRRINLGLDAGTIKRGLCPACDGLLLPPGVPAAPAAAAATASTAAGVGALGSRARVSGRGGVHLVVTCGGCGHVRRFGARREVAASAARAKGGGGAAGRAAAAAAAGGGGRGDGAGDGAGGTLTAAGNGGGDGVPRATAGGALPTVAAVGAAACDTAVTGTAASSATAFGAAAVVDAMADAVAVAPDDQATPTAAGGAVTPSGLK